MSDSSHISVKRRQKRHTRVRKYVVGKTSRPRLCVFRSNRHIVAQIIDDSTGRTLAAASSLEAAIRGEGTGNTASAQRVGALLAERAKASGVEVVVFDRGGFRYHGRVAALAEAARAGGLEF